MQNDIKSALVLEGGAMRGLFTAGVLDVLMDHSISFSNAVGVSAGAVFGSNYKSGQKGRTIRYNLKYRNDWRYCSLRSLLLTGNLFGADFCYRELPENLDPFDSTAFSMNPMAFDVVATDVRNGLPVYHRLEHGDADDLLWMRASASMPIVSAPVNINGQYYLDGGIADPIPYQYAKSLGCMKIAVILTQPREYTKESHSSSVYRILYHGKNRGIADAMERRDSVYNKTRELLFRDEEDSLVFIIAPDRPLDVKRTEKNRLKMQKCYDEGRMIGDRILPDLIKFLNS